MSASAFAGAKSANKLLDKGTVVIQVSYGKDKNEDYRLDRTTYAVLKQGMTRAEKVAAYWKINCVAIVKAFWKHGPEEWEGMTASQVVKDLRGQSDEERKPYTRLFSALAQSSPAWTRAESQDVKAKRYAKGSEEYEDCKALAKKHYESARKLASTQAQAILRHFAAEACSEDATAADTRERKSARMLIEETIADWNVLVHNAKGVFELAAERVLLGKGLEALRNVLAQDRKEKNRQNAIVPLPNTPTKGKTKTIKAKASAKPADKPDQSKASVETEQPAEALI
jgi:hypothetical protein